MAVKNPPLSEWFFSKVGTTTGVGTVRWKKYTIQQLLLPNITDEQRTVCDKINEHFPSRMQKENWQWRTCFVTKHSKVDEEMSEDKIYENLNKKLDEIKAFEEKVKAVM